MAVVVILTVFTAVWMSVAGEIDVMYQWPLVKFDTPFNYPIDPQFRADRSIINSLEVGWDKIYLTLPRLWTGNPTTLAWVPRTKHGFSADSSPPLQAYPSWDWHVDASSGRANCSGLISVFRTRADRCNRLWVLDSGVVDSLVNFRSACPPRLLVFDMRTDQLIRTVTFPSQVVRPNTLLDNLIIDDQHSDLNAGGYGSCDNVFVYMADTLAPAIVVYDAARDSAWRLSHPKMYPDPDFGLFNVAGDTFSLMDGILGMAISNAGSYRKMLYFQPFSSDRLFAVAVSDLQRGPNPGDDSELPITLIGYKSSQAAGLTVDIRDGSLIFAPVSEMAIAAWQPGSAQHKVVAYSPELLQFVLDFRSADRDEGNIWAVSTRFQKYIRRTLNPQDINLRVIRIRSDNSHLNNTLFLHKK